VESTVAPPSPVAEPTPADTTAAKPELSAEEISGLPRIEDLTPETDLTQFLGKGVPAALRNAALRRAWALDPMIRDHVGEARDYAYDWNVAGGVPGSGPIAEQDIAGLLRRVVGERETPPAAEAKTTQDQQTGESGAGERGLLEPMHPPPAVGDATSLEPVPDHSPGTAIETPAPPEGEGQPALTAAPKPERRCPDDP
jgi:hypothetical protein